MKKLAVLLVMFLVLGLSAADTFAQLTPAGTVITNQATASYNVGPTTFTENSNVTSTPVAELLDVNIIWQDLAPVTVRPGDTDQVATFMITNTGNGNDSYTLTGLSTLAGDDFDPTLNDLYFDSNNNGVFDYGIDAQYVPGTNDPDLDADSSVIVFLLNNIPTTLIDGELGNTQLTAESNTGTGAPGATFGGLGENGTDAVAGSSGGDSDAIATYVVSNVVVSIVKAVSILDPFGGSQPVPGAVMTYSLVVTISGTGTAENLIVTDVIPVNTTYVAGSITLNSNPVSDGVDGDPGDFGGSTANTVSVMLGSLSAVSPIQTVTFDVTIN